LKVVDAYHRVCFLMFSFFISKKSSHVLWSVWHDLTRNTKSPIWMNFFRLHQGYLQGKDDTKSPWSSGSNSKSIRLEKNKNAENSNTRCPVRYMSFFVFSSYWQQLLVAIHCNVVP
jgi:hypothetical protein